MAHALRLARRGLYSAHPNPCVGCLLVREDKQVGEGWHERAGDMHAEAMALSKADSLARGASCYVTLEPCHHQGRTPPCDQALVAAGVSRVVIAMQDPDPRVAGQGIAHLVAAGIRVEVGLMQEAASCLNQGYLKRIRQQRPYVRSKLAMSLDGRTAAADGSSRWISSAASRADVQRWRARSSAILTGISTVRTDDPRLTVRSPQLNTGGRQPLRVILDSALDLSPQAALLREPGDTLVIASRPDSRKQIALEKQGARILQLGGDPEHSLKHALHHLAQEEHINDLLVETGATLSGALLRAGLVDELILYVAPSLLGDQGKPLFHLPGLGTITEKLALRIIDTRRLGPDLRMILVPADAC